MESVGLIAALQRRNRSQAQPATQPACRGMPGPGPLQQLIHHLFEFAFDVHQQLTVHVGTPPGGGQHIQLVPEAVSFDHQLLVGELGVALGSGGHRQTGVAKLLRRRDIPL
jgi:hypothetical protein